MPGLLYIVECPYLPTFDVLTQTFDVHPRIIVGFRVTWLRGWDAMSKVVMSKLSQIFHQIDIFLFLTCRHILFYLFVYVC